MKKYKVILFLSIFMIGFQLKADDKPTFKKLKQLNYSIQLNQYTESDTPKVNLPYPISDYRDYSTKQNSRFDFNLPSNIQTEIKYNPETGMYDIYQKIGDRFYRYPTSMTREEYVAYQRKKAMNDYFQEKIEDEDQASGDLIPTLKIKNKGFDMIFGGDEISIRPQGSAELQFGVNISRYDNPSLPVNQRRVTTFDFQQKIQLNLVGQIGDKLKLEISQNTEATFNFQNQVKIGYTGYEDEIIQKIEAGNVTLPLNTSLIQGSQSLFGIRTDLKFGRLTVNTILSQQRGQRQEINVAGGAQMQTFEVKADNYEANKHYFLNFYHREHYNEAMETLPFVNSGLNITKIEVWVTNRVNETSNTRNIIAFTDLGETSDDYTEGNPTVANGVTLPDNDANNLYGNLKNNPLIREFSNSVSVLSSTAIQSGPFVQSRHYEKVENSRQLLSKEFTYNALLGYISLNQPLNQDEVLGVSYQYTYEGKTFQVGEFSTDVPIAPGSKSALILKLLKPTVINPQNKLWDLMMKNVYSLGAYQVGQEGFQLDVWYNNPRTSVDVNYLPYEGVDDKVLIQYLDLDQLNLNTERYADGRFDFVPFIKVDNRVTNGGTIDTRKGRMYFTTIEPFGETLGEKLQQTGAISPFEIDKIKFQELYDSTKTAAQQLPSKNRFLIKGSYKSSVSSDIALNSLNVPEGSVTVTAGGIKLREGVDYSVDYNLGRVKILDQGILEAETPIKVQLESNSLFGFNQKTLVGAHFNYEFNKDFNWGATVMNLTEKPLTQKVNVGNEPISNTVLGTDVSFRKEVPFLTKMVDFLPIISTKEKSFVTASGEFAYLIPGTQRAIGDGGVSYIDGFEGSQSSINISNFGAWRLASVPQGQGNLFPEAASISTPGSVESGTGRAHLAWYVIDPTAFYQSFASTPAHIKGNDEILQDSRQRLIQQQELFPQSSSVVGSLNNISTLDLAYYPKERGQYNYDSDNTNIDVDGLFTDPENRWAGIMRSLTTTNFETANVQYIQFWMLDPYNNDATDNGSVNLDEGALYFNLGNISEDVLPDSRKSFENGNPTTATSDPLEYDETDWAKVSNQQVVVPAFDNNSGTRQYQDIGIDGYADRDEFTKFNSFTSWATNSALNAGAKAKITNDPSSDNYNFYLDDDYDNSEFDIIRRYKYFNGMEGNSPTAEMSAEINSQGYPTSARQQPDIEDLNQDNNLSETENYYQYKVDISSGGLIVGQNYITNQQIITKNDGSTETWYQFKIPLAQPSKIVNNIADFRSIRFMRMFVKGFKNEKVFRFGRLELIRGTWREYVENMATGETNIPDPSSTEFVISAVNLEENESKTPVNYAIPPGINRENDAASINQRQLNEQSLALEICGLKDGDSRAAYKNITFDVRSYSKMRMFVHAEAKDVEANLKDNDLTCFVRLGTDFEDNYYEYELPMDVTPWGTNFSQDTEIWPASNEMVIDLDALTALKRKRDANLLLGNASTIAVYSDTTNGDHQISVKGNPNLAGMKVIMIGVRNPKAAFNTLWADDGLEKCAEVWVNELRLTDFKQNGGWATTGKVSAQLADFGNVSLAGNYSTPGWGSIEKKVSERQREFKKGFDFTSNFEMGQFFGRKVAISLPLYLGYSMNIIDPEYDLLAPDVRLAEYTDPDVRQSKVDNSRDLTVRRSFNVTNIRKARKPGKTARIWDVENLSLTYSYNELYRRDVNTEEDRTETYRGGLNYAFSGKPLLVEPFKKVGFLKKSKWFRLIKDANFYLGPKSISFNNNLQRMYNVRQNRNALDTGFVFLPTYYKNFTWDRAYTFKYDFTKNLKFSFSANNQAIVLEPQGDVNSDTKVIIPGQTDVEKEYSEVLRKTFNPFAPSDTTLRLGGFTKNYGHNYDVAYKVPLNKLPLTDWITATTKLRGSYDWQRAPLAQVNFGNTIQNSRNFSVNGRFNLVTLYNKIDFLKRVNNDRGSKVNPRKSGRVPRNASKGSKEDDTKKKKKKKSEINPIIKGVLRAVMSVRNVTYNYSVTDGMLLPGFKGETSIVGLDRNFNAPSFGFVSGRQNYDLFGRATDIWGADSSYANYAASNDWLERNSQINTQHTVSHTQNYSLKATIQPIKYLSINLSLNRTESENQNSYYRWSEDVNSPGDSLFQYQNPINTGNLNFTTITWRTASFEKFNAETVSEIFQDMINLRPYVSQLLGEKEGNGKNASNEYYDGFGENQQDVLIGSFLAAYTGKGTGDKLTNVFSQLPLPNWNVRYDGLSKYKFMKKYVKNFTLKHAYRSTTSIGNFSTNLAARDASGNHLRDDSQNFIADKQIQQITISEQFAPFLGVDATWNIKKNGLITKIEYKKDRSLALNIANSQITEMRGNEWVFGTGYKFSDVKMPFKFMGKSLKSDLNFRFDLSIRNSKSISRNIIDNTSQATSGQSMYSIKSSIDYNFGKNLNIRLYFDRVVNTPILSTSYPTANTRAGVALRFNLAQ